METPASSLEDVSTALAVDSINQAVYIAGRIASPDAYPGITSIQGPTDGFIAKYDYNGTLIWAFNLGGNGNDEITDIIVGTDGNIYCSGYIEGDALISGTSPVPDAALFSNGGYDALFACFDANGELQWASNAGGSLNDIAGAIDADACGVVFAGAYDDSNNDVTFFGRNPNLPGGNSNYFVFSFDYGGSFNWFTVMGSEIDDIILDDASISTFTQTSKFDLDVYDGQTFFHGVYTGNTMRFFNNSDNQNSSVTLTSSDPTADLFIVAISGTGNFDWSGAAVQGHSILLGYAISADCDGVYIGGSIHNGSGSNGSTFPGSYNFDWGAHDDAYIARLNRSTGITEWVRAFETGTGASHIDYVHGLKADLRGNVYVIGSFGSPMTYGSLSISPANGRDIFVAKIRNNGTGEWMINGGGDGDDYGYAIDFHKDQSLFIAGQNSQDYSLGPLITIGQSTSENIFLAKADLASLSSPLNCCYQMPVAERLMVSEDTICPGSSITLEVGKWLGDIFWQKSIDGGSNWNDISSPSPLPTFSYTPTETAIYRAVAILPDCPFQRISSSTLVIYEDNFGPEIKCPYDVTEYTPFNVCADQMITWEDPRVYDNCAILSVTADIPQNSLFSVGDTTVTYTAIDVYGNASTCSFNVQLISSGESSFNTEAPISIATNANECIANYTGSFEPILNYCLTPVFEPDSGGVAYGNDFPLGLTTSTYSITDSAYAEIVSVFEWDNAANDSLEAYIGPNAISANAVVALGGVNSGKGLLAQGNINFNIPGAILDAEGIDVSFDHRRLESIGTLFRKDSTVIFCSASTVFVSYRVEDGMGSYQTINSGPIQSVIFSEFHNYRFVYDPTLGIGSIFFDGTEIWTSPTPTPDKSLYWEGGNIILGEDIDAAGLPYTSFDNLIIKSLYKQVKKFKSFTVNVFEVDPPTIDCSFTLPDLFADPTNCQAELPDFTGLPSATDICDPSVAITQFPIALDSIMIGNNPITFTATDDYGNTDQCIVNVNVIDNTAPIIDCPSSPITKYVDNNCEYAMEDLSIHVPIINECSLPVIYDQSSAIGNTCVVGTLNVQVDVTDANNLSNSCILTLNIIDTIPPVIICPADIDSTTILGLCENNSVVLGFPFISDNCGMLSPSNDAPGSFPKGVTEVNWSMNDINGNTSTCIQTVTITDDEFPNITCPPDVTAFTDVNSCSATGVSLGTPPNRTDNCDLKNSFTAILLEYPIGVTTIIYIAEDSTGNISTCNQLVTVIDNVPPTIIPPTINSYSVEPGLCYFDTQNLDPALATDNCSVDTIFHDASATLTPGIYNIQWTATDSVGNSNFFFQIIDVVDNEIPVIIDCPPDLTVNSDAGECFATIPDLGELIASDNCDSLLITNDVSGNFLTGPTDVIWTVTDSTGNYSQCSQTIQVNDNEAPFIVCPNDTIINNTAGVCGLLALPDMATASDNCTFSPTISFSGTLPLSIGAHSITWTATDVSDNESSCVQSITVFDAEDPIATCPNDTILSTDTDACFASGIILAEPLVWDNCSDLIIENDHPSTTFNIDTTYVTWTITDAGDNSTTCLQEIIVQDTLDPTITCPSDLFLTTAPDSCITYGVSLGNVEVGDNCNALTPTNDAPFDYEIGITNVVWTVFDENGNAASCVQNVSVIDAQWPIIVCPPNIDTIPPLGICELDLFDLGLPGVYENCNWYQVSNNSTNTFYMGMDSVIWTVTDSAGNWTECAQYITLIDTIPPTITCTTDTVIAFADLGSCGVSDIGLEIPLINDNCGTPMLTSDTLSYYDVGTHIINWTIEDVGGNTDTCTQTLIIIDDQVPEIFCPEDITLETDSGSCLSIDPFIGNITATDNCAIGPSLAINGDTLYTGLNQINWQVLDIHGNSNSCVQSVTVEDNESPYLLCPDTIEVCDDSVLFVFPDPIDNCGLLNYSNDWNNTTDASDIYPYGETFVNWTAEDINANISTCTTLVIAHQQPDTISAGDNQTLLFIHETNLEALVPNAGQGVWEIISGEGLMADSLDPMTFISDLDFGPNILEWTVTNGTCDTLRSQVTITVNDIFIPSGFSPDGDNINDHFEVRGLEYLGEVIHLRVFNRWGNRVYEEPDYSNDWDGKNWLGLTLPNDTYFYILTVDDAYEYNGYLVIKR